MSSDIMENLVKSVKNNSICQEHMADFIFWCKTCKELICSCCLMSKHKLCDAVFLSKNIDEPSNILRETADSTRVKLMEKFTTNIKKYDSILANVWKALRKARQYEADVVTFKRNLSATHEKAMIMLEKYENIPDNFGVTKLSSTVSKTLSLLDNTMTEPKLPMLFVPDCTDLFDDIDLDDGPTRGEETRVRTSTDASMNFSLILQSSCDVHKINCTYWCVTCDIPICRHCFVEQHMACYSILLTDKIGINLLKSVTSTRLTLIENFLLTTKKYNSILTLIRSSIMELTDHEEVFLLLSKKFPTKQEETMSILKQFKNISSDPSVHEITTAITKTVSLLHEHVGEIRIPKFLKLCFSELADTAESDDVLSDVPANTYTRNSTVTGLVSII